MRRFSGVIGGLGLLLASCDGGDGAGDGSDGEDGPAPAPLVDVAQCPRIDADGSFTVEVGGVERTVYVEVPEDPSGAVGLLYTFHGLDVASSNPAAGFIRGFGLAAVADAEDVVVVSPEARPNATLASLTGQQVLLWGILGDEADDLELYDVIRSCVAAQWDLDLRRVSAWGFSGGALWTSLLLTQRADTLAAAVVASGGVGLEIPLLGDALPYATPSYPTPVLMTSGGEQDVWPGGGLTIIDFEASSDTLQTGLVGDGHVVARCNHTLGHTVPGWFWAQAQDWLLDHRYGEDSPFADGAGLVTECSLIP